MANLNKVELLGQLTREPECRTNARGEMVCAFGIKVETDTLNFRNEPIKELCFIEVEVTGPMGQVAQNSFHTGMMVFLDGRLRYESWTDRNTNRRMSRLLVQADNLQVAEGDGVVLPEPPSAEDNRPPVESYASEQDVYDASSSPF